MMDNEKEELMNKKQAAEYINVDKKFLSSLYKEGRLLPKKSIFGKIFFSKKQLDVYLSETKKR